MAAKPLWSRVAFGALAVAAIWLRLAFYEPLDRSVSNFDTVRYTHAAEDAFFSMDFFTSSRQPTVALVYQLAAPEDSYQVSNLSSPGDQIQPALQVQSGLDRVTRIQTLLSMGAWLLLAWVVFRQLHTPAFALLGAALVLLFGFVPHMAEWDYVMLTEPISLSLFVILLALSIEIVVAFVREGWSKGWQPILLLAGWSLALILWLFARDTNAYLLPIILGALILLALWKLSLEHLSWQFLAGAGAAMLILFLLTSQLAQASGRWVNPYFNNLLARILPVPEYRAWFEERGLPVSQELLAEVGGNLTELTLFEDQALVSWVEEHGAGTYIAFITTHPAWAVSEFFEGIATAFTENAQPFFRRSEVTPGFLVFLGDMLHPKDVAIIFVGMIELAAFAVLAVKMKKEVHVAMAGLFVVMLVGELVMLFVAILGDAAGTVRHGIGSVMPLRLSLWLLPPFILDLLPTSQGTR